MKPIKRIRFQEMELQDLSTLVVCALVIPFIWVFFFGWHWNELLTHHDTAPVFAPLVQELIRHHGDWSQLLYRPDLLGGFKLHDTTGTLPVFQLCAILGASVTTTINAAVLLAQFCFSFLGIRAALDLARFWEDGHAPEPNTWRSPLYWLVRFFLACVFAFTPVLGWKLSYGHMMLVYGSYGFLAFLALFLASRLRQVTVTLLVMATIALLHCFQSMGQQILLYSAVFGMPVAIGFAWMLRNETGLRRLSWSKQARSVAKALPVPIALTLATLAVSLPKLASMLVHARSTDSARSLDSEPVIFSFIISTLQDWASGIPWARDLIASGRPDFLIHEVNYPIGPLFLLLAFVPFRKAAPLLAGLGLSFLLAIAFSMNLWHVPETLIALVPPLQSFRVPARAVIPLCLLLPVIGSAGLIRFLGTETGMKSWRIEVPRSAGLIALFLLGAWIPALWRETLLWTIGFGAILFHAWSRFQSRERAESSRGLTLAAAITLAVFAGAGVSAFRERSLLSPGEDFEQLLLNVGQTSQLLQSQEPRLVSPLTRVAMNMNLWHFDKNAAFMLQVSTQDGYLFPLRRFNQLIRALTHDENPFPSTVGSHQFAVNSPIFPVLRQLYNVNYLLNTMMNGETQIIPLAPPGMGPAWFSASLLQTENFDELAGLLLTQSAELPKILPLKAWIVRSDPAFEGPLREAIPGSVSPECEASRVHEVLARRGEQAFQVKVTSAASPCPLILAMNYTTRLRAVLQDRQGVSQVPVFPVYGALTGILVPQGEHVIRIEPEPVHSPWITIAFWMGLAVILALLLGAAAEPAQHADQPGSA